MFYWGYGLGISSEALPFELEAARGVWESLKDIAILMKAGFAANIVAGG